MSYASRRLPSTILHWINYIEILVVLCCIWSIDAKLLELSVWIIQIWSSWVLFIVSSVIYWPTKEIIPLLFSLFNTHGWVLTKLIPLLVPLEFFHLLLYYCIIYLCLIDRWSQFWSEPIVI